MLIWQINVFSFLFFLPFCLIFILGAFFSASKISGNPCLSLFQWEYRNLSSNSTNHLTNGWVQAISFFWLDLNHILSHLHFLAGDSLKFLVFLFSLSFMALLDILWLCVQNHDTKNTFD